MTMNNFDYENNRVIGYADIFNSNGKIFVVGYSDVYNKLHKLNKKEAVQMFPPKGIVFAHDFAQRNEKYKKELVSIKCFPNKKEGENLDDFVWNKSEEVYGYGQKITSLIGGISNDGNENYNVFNQYGLIESDEEKIVSIDNKVFQIKANCNGRVIPYWNKNSLNVISIEGKQFMVDAIKPKYDGFIDLTSDDQLINWYLNKVLNKNWKEIISNHDFQNIENYIKDILTGMKNLDSTIIESRMQRLKNINTSFVLSLDELKHIAESPWLKNSIEKSVEKHKKTFLADYMNDQKEEMEQLRLNHLSAIQKEKEITKQKIKEIKDSVQTSVANLQKEEVELKKIIEKKEKNIADKEQEIENLTKRIEKLENLKQIAEERKEQMLEDFSIIKEVLNVGSSVKRNSATVPTKELKNFSTISVKIKDEATIMYNGFKKSIENTFKKNSIPHEIASTIGNLLAAYNILLVPNVSVAKGIILASKKCEYMMEYVSANWKSFDDLWDNGLSFIVSHSISNNDTVHFLVLQNINMTYLPNYMQPLIDIQAGIVDHFPGTDISFPDNLRILCTITEEEVMPLSNQCLKYIGCIDKTFFDKDFYGKIVNTDDSDIGYLSVELLKQAKETLSDVNNNYKQYTDE